MHLLHASLSCLLCAAPAAALDLATARIVDLTYTFDQTTLYWPTATSGFQLNVLHKGPTEAGFHYEANSLCAPEHGGTHLDAPAHFAAGRRTAEGVPLEQLVAPAVVLDVGAAAARDADYRLAVDDVKAWESKHGRVPRGAIVLLRTGWGSRWPDRRRHFGDDTPGVASKLHFPGYGKDAVLLLVAERGVAALGIDTASIDHGPSTDFPAHRVAAEANVPALENLARLDELPATGAWVIALPMKIGGGSGAPVRAIALLPGGR